MYSSSDASGSRSNSSYSKSDTRDTNLYATGRLEQEVACLSFCTITLGLDLEELGLVIDGINIGAQLASSLFPCFWTLLQPLWPRKKRNSVHPLRFISVLPRHRPPGLHTEEES